MVQSVARLPAGLLLACVLAGCIGCGDTDPDKPNSGAGSVPTQDNGSATDSPIRFDEVAARAGVEFTYHNGSEADHSSILESLGGGVGMLDFDLDGRVDLFFTGGGKFQGQRDIIGLPSALFRNLGDWKFERVTQPAGIRVVPKYSHGVTVGDFNQDGFPDFLVTGYGGVQLWENQGDGTFREMHKEAGIVDDQWSTSAGWGDLNGDGHLDLYIAHYVNWSFDNHPHCPGPSPDVRDICSPKEFTGLDDVVFYSNGDGTFRNATKDAGLVAEGKGLGVILCDVDNDGDLDIYVANDTTDNFLYLNDGAGRLKEDGLFLGVARDHEGVPNGSMGVDVCDYNRDGKPDLWAANYEREAFALYKNVGNGFLPFSHLTGITALGNLYVGFGTGFFDVDLDGDEDVVVANGHVVKYPRAAQRRQLALLLVNENARFRRLEFSGSNYFATPQEGRGLALGDLDNDGDLDMSVSHVNDPVALLANEMKTDGAWLSVLLVGVKANRDAVGARLVLRTSVGELHRQVKGGGSYLSHGDRRVFWGIPQAAKIEGLTIHWPSGTVQDVPVQSANQALTILESAADTVDRS